MADFTKTYDIVDTAGAQTAKQAVLYNEANLDDLISNYNTKIGDIADTLDEDDMASDSATSLATQQSIKAYHDSGTATLTNKTLTAPNISQVVFPATAVPSADANTLDDYEEGSFGTAAANGLLRSVGGSITCGTYYTGFYTKIGRQVHSQGIGVVSSVSSPTGATSILLPFAVIAGDLGSRSVGTILTSGVDYDAVDYLVADTISSNAYANIVGVKDNTASASLAASGISATDQIGFGITYFTSA